MTGKNLTCNQLYLLALLSLVPETIVSRMFAERGQLKTVTMKTLGAAVDYFARSSNVYEAVMAGRGNCMGVHDNCPVEGLSIQRLPNGIALVLRGNARAWATDQVPELLESLVSGSPTSTPIKIDISTGHANVVLGMVTGAELQMTLIQLREFGTAASGNMTETTRRRLKLLIG